MSFWGNSDRPAAGPARPERHTAIVGRVGVGDAVAALLKRDPGARARPGDLYSLGGLRYALTRAGASEACAALTARAVAHVAPVNTSDIAHHLTIDTPLFGVIDVLLASGLHRTSMSATPRPSPGSYTDHLKCSVLSLRVKLRRSSVSSPTFPRVHVLSRS